MKALARRTVAALMDGGLLFAAVLISQAGLWAAGWHPFRGVLEAGRPLDPGALHGWVFISTTVPFWLYYALSHSGPAQATLGKRLFGLRVATPTGQRPTFRQALIRALVMLVPFEVNHAVLLHLGPASPWFAAGLTAVYALLAVNIGLAVFGPGARTGHDRLAGTRVT